MKNLKYVGYVLLAILSITVFFSIGAAVSVLGFVISLIFTGAFFIGFIAFMIKTYFDFRRRT